MGMKRLFAGWITGLSMLVVAARAYALAGDVQNPSLAFPQDMPAAVQTRIVTALHAKAAKFLEGHFVNAGTTLDYGGDTGALAAMLAELVACDGVQVRLSFVRGPVGQSWTLKHNAWIEPATIRIELNLEAAAIDLQKLDLHLCSPPPRDPAASRFPAPATPTP